MIVLLGLFHCNNQLSVAVNDDPKLVHRYTVARAVGIDVHKGEKRKYAIIKDETEKIEEINVARVDSLNDKKIKNGSRFTCKYQC